LKDFLIELVMVVVIATAIVVLLWFAIPHP
jgi:hypothetical protein